MLVVFASLLASATALTYIPASGYSPYVYAPYNHHYARLQPQYPVYYNPGVYNYYPQIPLEASAAVDMPEKAATRGFFGIGANQQNKATLSLSTADSYTVEGTVQFKQTAGSSDSYYLLNLRGSGIKSNTQYKIGLASSCTATPVILNADLRTPWILINGIYATGTTSQYNIDASDGKTTLTGLYFKILDSSDTLIGCSTALAA